MRAVSASIPETMLSTLRANAPRTVTAGPESGVELHLATRSYSGHLKLVAQIIPFKALTHADLDIALQEGGGIGPSPDFSHNVGVIAGSHSLSCRFFNAQRFAVAH